MAIIFGSASHGAGLHAASPSVDEQLYSPVFDEEVDVKQIWQLLPSFYRKLMDDQDIFESIWAGMIPALSSELMNLWHGDYAKALPDISPYTQRKWVTLDLVDEVGFDTDPGLTAYGRDNFSVDEEADRLDCTWANRPGVDSVRQALRGEVTEEASLSWSFEVDIQSIDEHGGGFVGYFNSHHTSVCRNSLLVGFVGSSDGSFAPVVAHYSQSGAFSHVVGGSSLTTGNTYRFDCTYTARTTTLAVSVVQLDYEKAITYTLSGSSYIAAEVKGETGDDDDLDTYTNELVDDNLIDFEGNSVNFEDLGITEADTLVYEDIEIAILEVVGDTIYAEFALLPPEAEIVYSVLGEYEVASASINLLSAAGDNAFVVDQFGISNIDVRQDIGVSVASASSLYGQVTNRYTGLFRPVRESGESASDYVSRVTTALYAARTASATGDTTNWSYTDPTSTYPILYMPRIQSSLTGTPDYLYEFTDYSVESSEGKLIKFQEPPPAVMYAEYVAYDESTIYNNFGHLVGYGEDTLSSNTLRSRVRALFYSYFRGPTLNAIQTGVTIHMGLPIAEEEGTVESINEAYSGQYGQMVIEGKGYLYPLGAAPLVSVGDEVEQFQPLCRGVEVVDYINDPLWIKDFPPDIGSSDPYDTAYGGVHEIQKYHTFLLRLDIDAFPEFDVSEATKFVRIIKPTWKGARFLAFKEIEDEQDIDDEMTLGVTFYAFDSFCPTPNPYYDDTSFMGTEPLYGSYDWAWDQGMEDWGASSAEGAEVIGSMIPPARLHTRSYFWQKDTDEESEFLFYSMADREVRPWSIDLEDGYVTAADAAGAASIGNMIEAGYLGAVTTSPSPGTRLFELDYVPTTGLLTSIEHSGGTPDYSTYIHLKWAEGDDYKVHTFEVSFVVSDSSIEISALTGGTSPDDMVGVSIAAFEIRSQSPKFVGEELDDSSAHGVGAAISVSSSPAGIKFTNPAGTANFTETIRTNDMGEPTNRTVLWVEDTTGGTYTEGQWVFVETVVSDSELMISDDVAHSAGASLTPSSGKQWLLYEATTFAILRGPVRSSTTGECTAGSNTFKDTAGSILFVQYRVGDKVMILSGADAGTHEIRSIDDALNEIILDRDFVDTSTSIDYFVYPEYRVDETPPYMGANWATVLAAPAGNSIRVVSYEAVTGVSVPPGLTPQPGLLTIIDSKHHDIWFDMFLELCPDEQVILDLQLSRGYGETFVGTGNYSTGGDTVSSYSGPALSPGDYIMTLGGGWAEVATVGGASFTITASSGTFAEDASGARIYKALASALPGTLDFVVSSATVNTTNDLSGILSPGEWIQPVPSNDLGDVTKTPAVVVQSVSTTAVTLTAPYSGVMDVTGTKAITRSGSLPLNLGADLDGDGSNELFTIWYGQGSGDQITHEIEESIP